LTTLAEQIGFMLELFEAQPPTLRECEELAELLGSRQEFVAHLLLRRPALQIPALRSALAHLQSGAPAMAPTAARENFGQGAVELGRVRLEASLAKLIKQDATSQPLTREVAAALRQIGVARTNPLTRLSDLARDNQGETPE